MDKETVSFYSRRILTEQGMVEGVLQVADGKFAGLIENPNPAQIAAARDFADQRIFAGIIDLHSHGYRSWSANDRQSGNSGFIENSAFDRSDGDAGNDLGLEGA